MQTWLKDLVFPLRVSQITTWIKVRANQLRCMVYNPPIDVVKKILPKKFRKPGYSKVRYVIDCMEIFIETPSDP